MKNLINFFNFNHTLLRNSNFYLFSSIIQYNQAVKFTKTHEWVQSLDQTKRIRVGITDFAQSQLGEIVHVQLPTLGKNVKSGDSAMTIESVKMAADIYSPVSGKIVNINQSLASNPGAVNEAAEKTWLFEVEYSSQPSGLLSQKEYQQAKQAGH